MLGREGRKEGRGEGADDASYDTFLLSRGDQEMGEMDYTRSGRKKREAKLKLWSCLFFLSSIGIISSGAFPPLTHS